MFALAGIIIVIVVAVIIMALNLSIKGGPGAQPIHVNKIYFHIKGWEPRLALRKRLQVIRK